MDFSDGGLTITIPSINWDVFRWYHVFYISAIYGFLTQVKSLPAIHRFNKKLTERLRANPGSSPEWSHYYNVVEPKRLMLTAPKLFVTLLVRMIFILLWRIWFATVGICWIFLSFISTGIPSIRNESLKIAWRWHLSAEELGKRWDDYGPPSSG